MILDRQIRTILNMHIIEPKHRPFNMGMINLQQHSLVILKELHETCDFFQPLESLKGQCLADFYINDATQFVNHFKKTNSIIKDRKERNKKRRKEELEEEPLIKSLIESFLLMMGKEDQKEMRAHLNKLNLLRVPQQMTYDLFC